MENKIQVGDNVKWNGSSNKIYTVLEIEQDGRYLVTHPNMIFHKSGMWIYPHEIIRLVQKRDLTK